MNAAALKPEHEAFEAFVALESVFEKHANADEKVALVEADEHFSATDDCTPFLHVCARIYNRLRTK